MISSHDRYSTKNSTVARLLPTPPRICHYAPVAGLSSVLGLMNHSKFNSNGNWLNGEVKALQLFVGCAFGTTCELPAESPSGTAATDYLPN